MQRCADCTTAYADGLAACPHCSSTRRGGSALPSITVACGNSDCPACGVGRRIMLATLVPGVVAMVRPLCARCGIEMRIEKSWPPIEEEDTVPKIYRDRPPTDKADIAAPPADTTPEEETVVEAPPGPAEETPERTDEPMEPVAAAPDGTETELTGDGSGEALPSAAEGELEPPAIRDPRSAWLAYAKAKGIAGADDMTKAQLIEATKA